MATATARPDNDDVDTDDVTSGLHIKENWKGEGTHALFDGARLVTRSSSIPTLEDAMARIKRNGAKPFSSRVAPVEVSEDQDDEAPRPKNKRASWAE